MFTTEPHKCNLNLFLAIQTSISEEDNSSLCVILAKNKFNKLCLVFTLMGLQVSLDILATSSEFVEILLEVMLLKHFWRRPPHKILLIHQSCFENRSPKPKYFFF